VNLKIGALSFGGSGRMLLYRDAVVDEKKWITPEEFQEILTLSAVFPGPNLVNLAVYLGMRLTGWLGAFLGACLLALPGALLLATVVLMLPLENRHVFLVFQGFALGSVALFGVFIAGYARGLRDAARLKLYLRVLAAVAIGVASSLGTPLPLLLLVGGAGCLLLEFLT
jgi:chromate transporter